MIKTFVLDTNVLLQSPTALLSFGDNKVVLTEAVLEELDSFKKGNQEINENARIAIRLINELRSKGKLTQGVLMDNGGILKIETNHYDIELPGSWEPKKADNRILQVCKALQNEGEAVYLITKDVMERIKADIIDVATEDFESEMAPKVNEQYKGRRDIYIDATDLDKFYLKGSLFIKDLMLYDDKGELDTIPFFPHEFVIIHSLVNIKQTALGKVNGTIREIKALVFADEHPYGITPRNAGQKFMQEMLMADVDDIPLVIVKGVAGTAKTFLSLSVGLQRVVEDKEYRKILVCRPNVSMDEDLGFLPGSEQEKIAPYMRPIKDNLEILVDGSAKDRYEDETELSEKVAELFERGYIVTEAVGFLRGRSIAKTFVIIDEAQNLSAKQCKAIITRCGEGTKIVLIGDPDQIDNCYVNSRSNGLSWAADRMKGSKYCAQITMDAEDCMRSKLAEDAINRLK